MESLWPRRKRETLRFSRLAFHGCVALFNTLFVRLVIVTPLLIWTNLVREKGWGIGAQLGLKGFTEILVSLIVLDMLDYWWHRFNHRVPLLWRFHKVHHADTHVDVTTALRFHPGELFFSGFAKAAWILIWGPSLWAFAIFEIGISVYAHFHHSNIDLPDRVEKFIRWIHLTPRLHASHHTVKNRTRNGNFSTIFSIWDRLFLTFKEPDFQEMEELGLPEGRDSYLSPFMLLKMPFLSSYNSREG